MYRSGFGATNAEGIRHAHQFGQRFRGHFAHGVAAVKLYRDFADIELAGDLLIHQPGRDQSHYFSFARGKTVEVHPQF